MIIPTAEIPQKELNAVYGMYLDGSIVLDEPTPKRSGSRVVVVFLGEQRPKKPNLLIFSIYTARGKTQAGYRDHYCRYLCRATSKTGYSIMKYLLDTNICVYFLTGNYVR